MLLAFGFAFDQNVEGKLATLSRSIVNQLGIVVVAHALMTQAWIKKLGLQFVSLLSRCPILPSPIRKAVGPTAKALYSPSVR
jgi:hypothetical protein